MEIRLIPCPVCGVEYPENYLVSVNNVKFCPPQPEYTVYACPDCGVLFRVKTWER